MAKKIVIIGAGISGLSTAYFLKENSAEDLDITIIEKKSTLGGNINTQKFDGYLVEGGPDSFLSEKPWAMALCKRIGLTEELLPTNAEHQKTYIYSKKKLHPMPEGLILMIPTKVMPLAYSSLLSIPGKIRMGLELFIPKRKSTSDESFGHFVQRRLGKEALNKIAEPFIAGVHGGDPNKMSIKASFPKFVAMEQEDGSLIKGMIKRMANFKKMAEGKRASDNPNNNEAKIRITMFMSLKGGMTTLVDTLLTKIKDAKIRTETTVTDISASDGGYTVAIEGEDSIKADSVVICTPAYSASTIFRSLNRSLHEKLLTIPYASTSTISMSFKRSQIKKSIDGFGFVVPKAEGKRIIGSTWSSIKWAGRAPDDELLLRCFVGGSLHEKLLEKTDEEVMTMVLEDLKSIMDIEGEPVMSRMFRYKKAMPQYTIGHEERVEGIEFELKEHQGLFLTGSAYHGIGISDTVREAESTAKKVLASL